MSLRSLAVFLVMVAVLVNTGHLPGWGEIAVFTVGFMFGYFILPRFLSEA